jgi:hypothetical protein
MELLPASEIKIYDAGDETHYGFIKTDIEALTPGTKILFVYRNELDVGIIKKVNRHYLTLEGGTRVKTQSFKIMAFK